MPQLRAAMSAFVIVAGMFVYSPEVRCLNCEVPVWGSATATCESWTNTWDQTLSNWECPDCVCNRYSDDALDEAVRDLDSQSCSNACQFAGSGGYGNGCDYNGNYDGSGTPSGAHMIDGSYEQDPNEWPVTYSLRWAKVEGYCECTSNDEFPTEPMSVRPRVRLPGSTRVAPAPTPPPILTAPLTQPLTAIQRRIDAMKKAKEKQYPYPHIPGVPVYSKDPGNDKRKG